MRCLTTKLRLNEAIILGANFAKITSAIIGETPKKIFITKGKITMENEIMNYEEVEVIEMEPEAEKSSGMSTGGAMLLGAALTAATAVVVKLGKKLWKKHKAQKELRKPEDYVEVTDEDIADVAK